MPSSIELNRRPGESELSYINRLGNAKNSGLIDKTWVELSEIFNKNLREPGEYWNESTYRKKYSNMQHFREEFGNDISNDTDAEELKELRRELEKEKVKVRDERNEYRKLIREEARKESYKEQLLRSIEEAVGTHPLDYHGCVSNIKSDNDMIISLNDIHAGIKIHNYWNDFDENILKYRMHHYLDRIIEIQQRHNSENAYLIIGEILSGIIHPLLRIQNNQDLIDQFIMIMDYISEFVDVLSKHFNTVKIYVAPGNHSRVTPNKEKSLSHENMDNLIIYFLRAKLQNYSNVFCYTNDIEQSMAIFSVRNLNCVAVHGDKDAFSSAADKLKNLLRIRIDLIITGHFHTNRMITDGDVKVIQSGCPSGSDEYAIDKRLRNRPEQVVCIISETEGLDCVYDVKFD